MIQLKRVFFLFIAASFALTACHKDSKVSTSSLKLTVADTGKLLTLVSGQTFTVILSNPGDGGYNFNTWQYDLTILKLDGHTYTPPPNNGKIGDFGTDAWQFTTIKAGTTTMKITASQNSANTVTMFSNTVRVN